MEFVITKDMFDGSTRFNTWKTRVLTIDEEHDIDHYITRVVEEPSNNARRTTFEKNTTKVKRIIHDSMKERLMPMITPLKIAK